MVNSYHLSQRSLTCGLCCSAAQGWHHDGDSHYGPEVEILQVMYYPQSTPLEKGPTEVLPGSHFLPDSESANALARSGTALASSSGSIFITHYSVMHRRSASSCPPCIRNMLKYCYVRTTAPTRDWLREPRFDLHAANFGSHFYPSPGGSLQVAKFAAEMFLWLCNKPMPRLMGGQCWPAGHGSFPNFLAKTWGFPEIDLDADTDADDTDVQPPGNRQNPANNIFWGRGAAPGVYERERLEGNEVGALTRELTELKAELKGLKASMAALLDRMPSVASSTRATVARL